jgi:hypothetical protein
MARKLVRMIMLVLAVLVLMSTVVMAAEMICTEADKNGCTMAKGGNDKETKVAAPGAKVGDKLTCDEKGTCTKKILQ